MSCIESFCLKQKKVSCSKSKNHLDFIKEFDDEIKYRNEDIIIEDKINIINEYWIVLFVFTGLMIISFICCGIFYYIRCHRKKNKSIMSRFKEKQPEEVIEMIEIPEKKSNIIIGYNSKAEPITSVYTNIIVKNNTEIYFGNILIGKICLTMTKINAIDKKYSFNYYKKTYTVKYDNKTILTFKLRPETEIKEKGLDIIVLDDNYKLLKKNIKISEKKPSYPYYAIIYQNNEVFHLANKGFIKIINKSFILVEYNLMFNNKAIIENLVL